MKKATYLKKVNDIAKKAGRGAVSATAKVISAPSVMKSKMKGKRADSDFKVLKMERGYKGMPDFDLSGKPTEGLKARTMAESIRMRRGKK